MEQIDACLHSSDYSRALALLEQATAEFPNDAELAQLEKLANDGLQRATEAHRLMTEGQELCAQDRFADGIKLLKEAYELDEHNALTRAVFSNALVEQARLVAETNWQEADQLARQAFELNPSHPLSKTVRTLILDQKREQTVTECVSQARKLQAGGDLAGAFSRIEEALAAYPRELRLIQIQETLQRELQSQRRQARRRDLEELRRMDREAETISDPAVKQVFGVRVQVLAGKYLEDEEVLALANGILGRLDIAAVQGKGSGRDGGEQKGQTPRTAALPTSAGDGATASIFSQPTEVPPWSASGKVNRLVAPVSAESAATPPPVPPPVTMPPSEGKPQAARDQQASSSPSPIRPMSWLQLPLAAIAAVVAGLLLLAIFFVRHRHPSIPASTVARVTVHTSPPGATIRINHEVRGTSNLQVDLPQGSYQIEAELNGYQSKATTIEAKAGSPVAIDLSLDPALPVVKLSSDTGAGTVSFDDQPPVELEGAQWTLDKLASGEHKLKFDGKQGNASFTFSSAAGAMPAVKGRIAANRLLAVVVSNLGGQVHVYSSDPAAKLSLDRQSPAAMPENGWELPQVSAGTHELALIHGDDQYKLDIDLGPAPTLATFLMSGQNIGTLIIVTGEDKARVFLDGQMQKGTTQGGQLRIPNLEPKDYVGHGQQGRVSGPSAPEGQGSQGGTNQADLQRAADSASIVALHPGWNAGGTSLDRPGSGGSGAAGWNVRSRDDRSRRPRH